MYKLIPSSINYRITDKNTLLYRCPKTVEFSKVNLTFFIDLPSDSSSIARVDVFLIKDETDVKFPIATNIPLTLPEVSPELTGVVVGAGDELHVEISEDRSINKTGKFLPVNVRAFIYEEINPRVTNSGFLTSYITEDLNMKKLDMGAVAVSGQCHGTLIVSNPTKKDGVEFNVWLTSGKASHTTRTNVTDGKIKSYTLEPFETIHIENVTVNDMESLYVQANWLGICFLYNGLRLKV